jgi:amino acid transporter
VSKSPQTDLNPQRGSQPEVLAAAKAPYFERSLGTRDLLVYGLVFVIPISPVPLFGVVFNASHGMVPLTYLLGFCAMMFTALSYMMMTREYPLAGSVYTYASKSLSPIVGFVTGWTVLLDYFLVPALSYVSGAIAIHSAFPKMPKQVFALAMLLAVTLVNCRGIRAVARANTLLLALQLSILMLFVVLAIHALSGGVAGAHFSLEPFYRSGEMTPAVIFGALSVAALSFLGFDAISTLSEESSNGAKGVARATILTLIVSAAFFVVQTWLACLFFLEKTKLPAGNATNTAFYDVAELLGGYWFKFVLAVFGIVVAAFAGAVASQAAAARILFGMARDKVLPPSLAYLDPARNVPTRAIIVVATITLIVVLPSLDYLEFLASTASFGAMFGFLILHLTVIFHFRRLPSRRRWMRHFISPIVGFSITAYVLLNASINAKIAGSVWMVAGLLLRWWLGGRGARASFGEEMSG